MVVNFNNDSENTESEDEENKDHGSLMDKINNYLLRFTRISLKDKLFFVQHLSLMLRSGISISTALKTLSSQSENLRFKQILADLSKKLEEGVSFSDALRNHDKIFSEMFVSMMEAGELSGKLEEVLREMYLQMKKEYALISKLKGPLTYPAVILMAMVGIGTFMLIFVVPKITAMFDDMDAELPMATKILISVSDALAENSILSGIIAIIVIYSFLKTIKTEKGKFYFHLILLKTPVFGPIIKKINLARFARNISSLLKTDIMIIKAFEITSNVLGNVHYKKALLDMSQKIKKGKNINIVAAEYPNLFPPLVTQMIAVGEETGEIDSILLELAEFYEDEVNQIMENLPAIIEPLLILTLGLGVGGVAVAVIMPMYSLTDAI